MPLPASLGAKRRENFRTLTIEFSSGVTSAREKFFPHTRPFFTRDLLAVDGDSTE